MRTPPGRRWAGSLEIGTRVPPIKFPGPFGIIRIELQDVETSRFKRPERTRPSRSESQRSKKNWDLSSGLFVHTVLDLMAAWEYGSLTSPGEVPFGAPTHRSYMLSRRRRTCIHAS